MANAINRLPLVDGRLGWFELSAIDRTKPIISPSKDGHYDFIVVGAGFSGIATSRRLAELHPKASIALIDALKVGQGTSGRNAGFIIDVPHNLDASEPNTELDGKIRDLNCFAIQRLQEIQGRQQTETQWQRAGKFLAAHETRHLTNLRNFQKTLNAIGAEYVVLDRDQLTCKLGTSYYQQAIYTPGNILMNPAALVRTAANDLPGNVDLFEDLPILSIDRRNARISHPSGKMSADTLVLTVNSFNSEFGGSKKRLAPIFTYASLTRTLSPSEMAPFDGVKPWGLTSAHPAGSTVRFTNDHRIFIRNFFDASPKLSASEQSLKKARRKHQESIARRFPQLENVSMAYSWGGMLCMTMNHQPVFRKDHDGVFELAGMNGVGVAKGTYLGYYLAEFISGKTSEDLSFILKNSNPSWVPPEPLKSIGANLRLSAEQRIAKGEV